METITSWKQVATISAQQRIPIIVMVDQEDCPYCDRVEGEFFSAIFAGGEFENAAIFGKISLDDSESIVTQDRGVISTQEFLRPFFADFTPTILFLDSQANQLVEKMVGLSTPDYYGYYLEKAIWQAHHLLNT